jgi:hypothetical protein
MPQRHRPENGKPGQRDAIQHAEGERTPGEALGSACRAENHHAASKLPAADAR